MLFMDDSGYSLYIFINKKRKMKKNFILLCTLIVLIFTSCRKTEVYSDELTTDVIFNTMIEEDLTINKSSINRDVLGEDFVNIAISSIEISAEHVLSGQRVEDTFDIIDDGSGKDEIRLNEVNLGENIFRVNTTSYIEVPETDPVYWQLDGFSSNNIIGQDDYPFSLSEDIITTTDSLIKYLRIVKPFVEFTGETTAVVNYNNCKDSCNEVILDMVPQQGRWITTVEFENTKHVNYYKAIVVVSHDAGDTGPISSRTVRLNPEDSFAWFYMTYPLCNEDLDIIVEIYIKEIESNEILRYWKLTAETYPNELTVVNGVDRWVKIIINDHSIKSGCIDFKFNWEWNVENTDINLN